MPKDLPEIRFESIYPSTPHKNKLLYELLAERTPDESISHSEMPTFDEHESFIMRHPYREWCIVMNDKNEPIGSFYVTYKNEVGIAVLMNYRRKGYASAILKKVIETNGDIGIIANINPNNSKSIALFEGLGFNLIQKTYRYKK